MAIHKYRRMTYCSFCRQEPKSSQLWVTGWTGFHGGNPRLFCNDECWSMYKQMPSHKNLSTIGLTLQYIDNLDVLGEKTENSNG